MIKTGMSNKSGMTIAELRAFLERCRMVDVPETTQPKVRITLSGKIKAIEAEADDNE